MDRNQLESATATPLQDLVQVAEGAIVSRTLLGEEGGRVVLFSFDRGQGLSEHTTPFEALVHVLEGAFEIRVGGKPSRVEAGSVLRMPGGVSHGLEALEPSRMLLVMLKRADAVAGS